MDSVIVFKHKNTLILCVHFFYATHTHTHTHTHVPFSLAPLWLPSVLTLRLSSRLRRKYIADLQLRVDVGESSQIQHM